MLDKRRLGRTEMMVSAVSFGALPIQRCTLKESGPVLEKAIQAGINFFDTARSYTDSEEKIGTYLSQKRDRYYLASKSMARDYESMLADIELSLKTMKTDCIDLYQVHNIKRREDLDLVLGANGALKALQEKQQEGKIRFIGVTGHSFDLLVEAIETDYFDTVQAPFNVVEQEAEKRLFPLARKKDLGIIVMKPLGGGQIEQTLSSLKFILEHDNMVAIPGMDKIEHVTNNVQAASPVTKLTNEERQALEEEAKLVGKVFCRRCGYCMPCVVGIDIPQLFIFRLQYNRYGLTNAIPQRYNAMEKKASDCIKCGMCEKKCPYDLPIRLWMKELSEKLG